MRRLARFITALLCLLGATLVGAMAAHAGPYGHDCADISASTTAPNPGQSIEVSGAKYEAGEDVAIYIGGTASVTVVNDICQVTLTGGTRVGTAHTDSSGAFDPSVTVPESLSGDQPLTGIGASGDSFDRATITLTIGGSDNGGTGGNNGTSFTGVEVMALLVTAGLLLLGGVALARAGKRRTATPHGAE